MKNLTLKQQNFFELLVQTYGKDALPSLEVIRENLGYKSKNSIAQYLKTLKGVSLVKERSGRLYIKTPAGAPLLATKVRAGFANALDDIVDKRISFDEILQLDNPSVFVFKVSGDSMVELGIFEGDYVSIKKTSDAQDGDIVLASIDGSFTLKTYRKKGQKIWLEAANPQYGNIYPKNSLTIFGVATGITRRF